MKVLKFGGSSVASAENIRRVVSIIKSGTEPQIIVVSALGGVTDQLIHVGSLAEKSDEFYKDVLKQLEYKHLDTARTLLPVKQQSSCLSMVKQHFNELEEICSSVFYLKELSLRTKDRIISFGELLSSKIISAYFFSEGLPHEWLDARKLIKTNSSHGFATVNFSITNDIISYTIKSSGQKLFLTPGFISSD